MKYRKECLGECEYPSVILFDHLALHAVYFEGGNIKKFSTLICYVLKCYTRCEQLILLFT